MQNILIEKLIAEHRAKAFITCDENCFCWVIERVLTAQDSRLLATDAPEQGQPCPRCKGEKYVEVQLGEYEECDWCAGFGQVKTAPVR